MKKLISASILNADFSCLESQIQAAEKAGVDWIHLDIMDGHFAPNLSFGPQIGTFVRKMTKLPIDTHLMIDNPDQFIDAFADAGADYISVHVEGNPHIHRTLQNIQNKGKHAGIVVNPGTPVQSIYPVLHMVKYVLIMSVNPGFGGQSFIPAMLDKLRRTKSLLEATGSEAMIQVDGGIDPSNIRECYEAGATNFVAGSSIFKHADGIAAGINALRQALAA